MSRRTARKHAFFIVYQMAFHEDFNVAEACEYCFAEVPDVTKTDSAFIQSEVFGTVKNLQQIDTLISEHAIEWSIERLSKIDHAIMRLAVYEILFADDVPTSVSINEAVEIAKEYGDDNSPSFINGVLGKIAKSAEKV